MMKRIAIMLLLALASCTKASVAPEEQKVVIYVDGVQRGDFTKADGTAINDLIATLLPTSGITFQVVSTTVPERSYTVSMGSSIALPLDTYKVTAAYKPKAIANTYKNGDIYQAPRFYVDDTITVVMDQDTYTVDAVYDCWALVIDYDVCAKYQHLAYSSNMEDFTYIVIAGNIGVAFINGTYTSSPYIVKASPSDAANYEPRQYSFVTNGNYSGTLVENGKWYALSPSPVETSNGGVSVEYSQWTEGAL